MKRLSRHIPVAAILVVIVSTFVRADVTRITGGVGCGNPGCSPNGTVEVMQGKKTLLMVDGQDVNFADKSVDVSGNDVSARIVKDHAISPAYGLGTGRAEVEVDVSLSAAAGERTVILTHRGCPIGCPKQYKFKILILRDGRITEVDAPYQSDFFQQADVVFTGTRIGNAKAILEGFPAGTTAQVVENTESRAVVRLGFTSSLAFAQGKIKLYDKACTGSCPTNGEVLYRGLSSQYETDVTVEGPNAVKDITFPDGNVATIGGVFTFQINLVRPAIRVFRLQERPGAPPVGGVVVHWQLVPSHFFEAAPGSNVTFTPTGLNQIRVPGGDTLVRVTVRVRQVPDECPQRGCDAEVQTRMGNINTNQPPYFRTARFFIRR